jgi:predicted nuclease of predicted toxin-antitoxin system
MKLVIDMNLSPRWEELLQQKGIEAVHWSKIGRANAPDSEIMRYAFDNGFSVLTHDLDFSAMLAHTHGNKPSVIQIRGPVTPEICFIPVANALAQFSGEIEMGALIAVDPRKTRVNILPL